MASFDSLPEELLPLIFKYMYFIEKNLQSTHENALSICLISKKTLHHGIKLLYQVVGIHLHELHHKLWEGPAGIARDLVLNPSKAIHTKVLNLSWILTQEHNSIGSIEGDFVSSIVQYSLVQARLGYLKQLLNHFTRLTSLRLAGRLEGFNLLTFCLQELTGKSLRNITFQGVRNFHVGPLQGYGILELLEGLNLHPNLTDFTLVDPPGGMILPSSTATYIAPTLPLRSLSIIGGVSESTDWTDILIASSHTTLTHLVLNTYSGANLLTKLIARKKLPNLISLQINLYSDNFEEIKEFIEAIVKVLEFQTCLIDLKLIMMGTNTSSLNLLSPFQEINLYNALPLNLVQFKSNLVQYSNSMRSCWRLGAFENVKELWVHRNEKWEDVRVTRLMGY